MDKVLIIGASILQLPAIIKAKELGYYVGVADYNPKAIGISYADEYFNVSTIDANGITEVAKRFKPKGIMTLATDMPMRSVATACMALGLPGISIEAAIKATDKGEMIRSFEENNVEHPWYKIINSVDDLREVLNRIDYPCIIKPTDNAGSRGVVLCHDREELEKGYQYSQNESRSGSVIIEEYLSGPEFSVEIIVSEGVPYVLQITDKLTTGAPHFVEMGHSQPTSQPDEKREKIADLAVRACKAIGISTGPAHVEIILTEKGPRMVELGARMGGDCITTHLVPLSTGIDMVGCVIKMACGEKVDLNAKWNKGSAIRYFKTDNGTIKRIEGIDIARKIHGVKEISIVHQVGERIEGISSSVDRIGFVIAQGDDATKAVEICEEALGLIEIEVVSDAE